MLAHRLFIGCDIDAIDFVRCHVAFEPLNLWPEVTEHAAGFLRNFCKLVFAELARARDLALDHIFGHDGSLSIASVTLITPAARSDNSMSKMEMGPGFSDAKNPTTGIRFGGEASKGAEAVNAHRHRSRIGLDLDAPAAVSARVSRIIYISVPVPKPHLPNPLGTSVIIMTSRRAPGN
jgi:hypothetical protein